MKILKIYFKLKNFYNSCSFNKSNGDWILQMSSKPSKVPLSNLLQRKFIWRKLDGALSNVYYATLSSKCQDVKDDWQFQCYFTIISSLQLNSLRGNNVCTHLRNMHSFHHFTYDLCQCVYYKESIWIFERLVSYILHSNGEMIGFFYSWMDFSTYYSF